VSVSTVARVGGALALLCLAVVLALLARDVLAWRGQTERTDVAIAHSSKRPVGEPHTWLPVAVSRFALDAGDDIRVARLLQGVQRLRVSSGPANRFDPPAFELARLELAFDEIAHSPGPVTIRSRAQQLHAILLFQQLTLQGQGGSGSAATALERTIAELQRAVRLDPANAEAQYDLETVLLIYKPIATQTAGERAYQKTKKGNVGGAGGAAGAVGELGGY
jgi:hypothetical protein